MKYKGVELTVTELEPFVWRYSFVLNGKSIVGRTRTSMKLLAIRRAKMRFDRELKRGSALDAIADLDTDT